MHIGNCTCMSLTANTNKVAWAALPRNKNPKHNHAGNFQLE